MFSTGAAFGLRRFCFARCDIFAFGCSAIASFSLRSGRAAPFHR
jgi:hypothetical protein